MSKKIDINHTFVKTPIRITVDGKNYPITGHNIQVVRAYWESGDDSELDKLNEISFSI